MGRDIKTLFIVIAIVVFSFQFPMVYANTPCKPIYGGGQTCTSSTNITPDKKSTPPAVTIKGGFPIMPPPTISKTPATGSESLALFSLIPIGIAGFFLRRRSKQ